MKKGKWLGKHIPQYMGHLGLGEILEFTATHELRKKSQKPYYVPLNPGWLIGILVNGLKITIPI